MVEWCGLIIVASTRLPRYLSFEKPPVNVNGFPQWIQPEAILIQAPGSNLSLPVRDHWLVGMEMRHRFCR